jgi:hypothetical protein
MTHQYDDYSGPAVPLDVALDADCREFRGGHKAVCAMLGEPYGPFQKRLSGAYPDHHLKPDDFARVVELVRGRAVRTWFEQVYGVVSYQPVPVPATRDAMQELGKLLAKEGEFVASLAGGAADSRWERNEVAKLEEHGFALISKLLAIMAGAREAMEGDSRG